MAENTLKLEVIAPERVFYMDDVTFVEFCSTEGDLGIYPNHISLTSIIAPGVLRIHETNGTIREAALLSGFAEILSDRITILAESVEWPDEIDANRAREAKIRAERRLNGENGEIDNIRAELALRRSIIRLSLTNKR